MRNTRLKLNAQHRQPRCLPLFAAVMVLIGLLPAAAVAQDGEDLERELDAAEGEVAALDGELGGVRDEISAAEEELALAGARLADARARLTAAEGQVALAEEALVEAEEARDRAVVEHERAEERLVVAERQLAEEEALLVDQIVSTFKYGTTGARRGSAIFEVLRRAENPNAYAVGMKQLQVVVDDQDTQVARVFAARERRADLAEDAERARGRAAQAADDAAQVLASLEERRAEAVEVADEIAAQEARQREILASLQVTAEETEGLLAGLEQRREELQRELNQQRAREEAERRAREEAAREAEARRTGDASALGGAAIEGMVCPVVGAVAGRDFSNDWGYPRAGGRSHEGSDMFAARGTPVVAVADAVVIRWNPPSSPSGLGGITVTYRTADGTEWYNAHLDSVAPGIAPGVEVSRGQRIGTVGNTGNAITTPPHLHLGRYHGGAAVNPWPTTSGVCR